MANLIDLSGQRFGNLIVIEYVGRNEKNTSSMFRCKCDCGNIFIASSNNLRRGNTKSCGCYKKKYISEKNSTHGCTNTRLFHIWQTMKARCNNPNSQKYKRYGGRGITICDEWNQSFVAFQEWSLSNGYSEELSIDRIDNDGNYCPENCRWVSTKVQGNNTSVNVLITYNGETHTATEWSRILGVNAKTILRRKAVGWTDEECIEVPVSSKNNQYTRKNKSSS